MSANRAFHDAVHGALFERLSDILDGITAYRAAPPYVPFAYTRATPWEEGAAHLRRIPGGEDGSPVLLVPSLINRAYVMDLLSTHSFAGTVAAAGYDVWLLDWGGPGDVHKGDGLSDYVVNILLPAIEHVHMSTGRLVHLAGYCLGGTLTVAAALVAQMRNHRWLRSLTVLAAPWDFAKMAANQRGMLGSMAPMIRAQAAQEGRVSGAVMQMYFASLDPTLNGRKFAKLGRSLCAEGGDVPVSFSALEDWVNDPVDLAGPVALECIGDLYDRDDTMRGNWRVGETLIQPEKLALPVQVHVPTHDRIVPVDSALPLGEKIPGATIRQVPLGHVGMMTSSRALALSHAPVINWLKTR